MGTWTLWIAFNAGVALFLLLDLGLFHRRAHAISLREAALESAVWVALSVGFGFWIFFSHGRGPGLEFFTGYVIEKSLSVDNVFVFLLIFQYFPCRFPLPASPVVLGSSRCARDARRDDRRGRQF